MAGEDSDLELPDSEDEDAQARCVGENDTGVAAGPLEAARRY